jgi:hypothetical protein
LPKDNPIFKTELNEERIINEFKSTIKQRYLLMHNTNMNNNNTTCTSSSTTANSIYYATSAMNHTNKSFNLVTKAMSKYNYMSNYEQQQQQQHQHQSTSYANSKQNTGDHRLANNTSSNSCSKTLRHQAAQQHSKYTSSSASKTMSNSNSSTYQLPDRRAKKPKIDSDINNKVWLCPFKSRLFSSVDVIFLFRSEDSKFESVDHYTAQAAIAVHADNPASTANAYGGRRHGFIEVKHKQYEKATSHTASVVAIVPFDVVVVVDIVETASIHASTHARHNEIPRRSGRGIHRRRPDGKTKACKQ